MMEYPFETYGHIKYNPRRGSLKRGTNWWLTIELDNNELSRYYRWWIDKVWWEADSKPVKRNYHKPPHHSHISIIRGEKPLRNIDQWGKYRANEQVTFRYSPVVKQTSSAFYADEPDQFWFLEVEWKDYTEFRKYYGLKWEHNNKPFHGHITVARTYD